MDILGLFVLRKNLSLVDPKDDIKQAKNNMPREHPTAPFKGNVTKIKKKCRLFLIWIASQASNDGTCNTSLRGGTTKQSRNKSVILVTLPSKGGIKY